MNLNIKIFRFIVLRCIIFCMGLIYFVIEAAVQTMLVLKLMIKLVIIFKPIKVLGKGNYLQFFLI